MEENPTDQWSCFCTKEICCKQHMCVWYTGSYHGMPPQSAYCAICEDRIWGLGRQVRSICGVYCLSNVKMYFWFSCMVILQSKITNMYCLHDCGLSLKPGLGFLGL